MRTRKRGGAALAVGAFCLAVIFAGGAGASAEVVVEKTQAANMAAEAGLQAGDRLLGWERHAGKAEPGGGELSSPYELRAVETEEAPRGPVRIRLRRDGSERVVEIGAGEWRVSSRPDFAAEDLARFERGQVLLEEDVGRALAVWSELAVDLEERGSGLDAVWLLERVGEVTGGAVSPDGFEAESDLRERAAALATRLGHEGVAALVLRSLALRFEEQSDLRGSAAVHRRVVDLRRELVAESGEGRLELARSLGDLGKQSWRIGEISLALEILTEALEIRRREAPGTVLVGAALNNLAIPKLISGDFANGGRYLRDSYELLREVAPTSHAMVGTLNNLAIFATRRGRFDEAVGHYQGALRIVEKLEPGGSIEAAILSNLSELTVSRGDLAQAERYLRRAEEIQERTIRRSLDHATTLNNLALIKSLRGELESALELYERTAEIREEVAPGDYQLPKVYASICSLAARLGLAAEAEKGFERAVARLESLPQEGIHNVTALSSLGACRAQAGDLESAEEMYSRALSLARAKVPGSLHEAQSLNALGEVHASLGRAAEAQAEFGRALEISNRVAPDSLDVALAHHGLAEIHRTAGDAVAARRHFEGAAMALEEQSLRLGGDYEASARFQQRNAGLYRSYVRFLLEVGRPREAFQIHERSRARAFLSLLAAHRVRLPREIGPELEGELQDAIGGYDRALGELATRGADAPADELEDIRSRLEQARRRRDDVRARVWSAAPRLAEAERPQTLELASVEGLLGSGTLLLSFFVDQDTTFLFALGPGRGEFEVFPLDRGEPELTRAVARFRRLLAQAGDSETLRSRGRDLSLRLLQPAAAAIERSERILVAPDGPLHSLPFAALADPARPDAYLIEAVPVTVVASATVYSQLARRGRARATVDLTAFGDPSYGVVEARTAADTLRAALGPDLTLSQLPGTRREVEAIASLFPDSASVFLGAGATEERAKSESGQSSYVHFACHAVVDQRFPLDSALVLALPEEQAPGSDNGLLQAWEILEEVELKADLVTLSACDTARGAELAGEGLVGLTRAFQFAGARAVLASLWSVGDAATAELMERFYGQLKEGAATDEALRQAQLDLLSARETPARFRHPFFWAAFQLAGDWR